GLHIPFVQAQASWTDPKSMNTYSTNGNSDGTGFLNLTAPFGRPVVVNASAPDYNGSGFLTSIVNTSNTSYPGGTGPHALGNYSIDSYGWVLGNSLNYSLLPPPISAFPSPVIVDPANGRGVPD